MRWDHQPPGEAFPTPGRVGIDAADLRKNVTPCVGRDTPDRFAVVVRDEDELVLQTFGQTGFARGRIRPTSRKEHLLDFVCDLKGEQFLPRRQFGYADVDLPVRRRGNRDIDGVLPS